MAGRLLQRVSHRILSILYSLARMGLKSLQQEKEIEMYKGVLTTKHSRVEKEDDSFHSILHEMELLKREYIHKDIESIDIFEDEKVVAALRVV